MTFRARPVAKRPSRAGWDSDERRSALINGGFVLAIVVAIVILIGYAGWSYYSDHWGTAATVDGQVITRDDLRAREDIENFRITYTQQRIRDLLAQGHVSQADAQSQLSYLQQRQTDVQSIALERLIDIKLQTSLAAQEGVAPVTDADIDAELATEATIDEERHVWLIACEPGVDPNTGQVSDATKAAAKAKCQDAADQIKGGKAWEDVAKTTSTDTTAAQAGDLGWLPKDKTSYDQAFMDAVFAAAQNTPTDPVLGDDGIYRVGRATDIAAKDVDQAFQTKITDYPIKLDDYRAAVKADVIQNKLSDKVVADLSQPSKQRHVLQIFLPDSQASADSIKIRQIVFAPNHDMAGAPKVPADDPAWATAKANALAAYKELQLDPEKFDTFARTQSDDKTSAANGGKVGYIDTTYPMPKAVEDAVFAKGLQNGEILPPIQTESGWYVVQFVHPYGDGDGAWMDDLKTRADAGIDFSQLARDNSLGAEAKDGGDIGWVVQGQLGDIKEGAIFETPVGSVSDVVTVQNEGLYLYKVLEEATRTPDAKQIQAFKDSGFSNWYALKKSAATITRDPSLTGSATA
ncbi:MAG TPA: peptidylprolyl isomerase [Candidatus Limnocylindrales bacterium]|jgi:parvulin-like peptidyl-prolyl isomerase